MKTIKNVSQINEVLHRIAELEVGISEADNGALEIINTAKAEAEVISRPLIEERDALIEQLQNFSAGHREELYVDG
ncbi:host-nuclease inhibitor Gam family protein, partial [Treponema pedis]|uniref:host-nuclease inhibitor Gam family protein n=1 Tax=Treponema pedis TaxID=409322 RepID=UPI003D1C6B64